MSRKKVLGGVGLWVALVGVGIYGGLTAGQQAAARAPESLLPAEAVAYLQWDGIESHRATWEQTGLYGALFKTSLGEFFSDSLTKLVARAQGPDGPDPEGKLQSLLMPALNHIARHGVTAAVSLRNFQPGDGEATAVIHAAGRGKARELFVSAFEFVFRDGAAQFEEFERGGRQVSRARSNVGEHVMWWSEGDDLVISFGSGSEDVILEVAEGKRPSLTTNPLLARYAEVEGFDKALTAWLDSASLWNLMGEIPGKDGLAASRVLRALGLNRLEAAAFQWGFEGEQLRSVIRLDAPRPRSGLLALLDQEPFSVEDLPPLPRDPGMVFACSIDWPRAYDTILSSVVEVAEVVDPDHGADLNAQIGRLPALLGFDPRRELLESLGNVTTFYTEPAAAMPILNLQIGAALVIEVTDAGRLRDTLERLVERVEQLSKGQVTGAKRQVAGAEVHYLQIAGLAGLFIPSFAVTDEWLVIGLSPQSAEGFAGRAAGAEPRWEPTPEWLASRRGLPESGVGLTFGDPRSGVEQLLALAPTGTAMARQFLGVELDLAKVPPADEVTAHLFPNVSVVTVDDQGLRSESHSSVLWSGNEGVGVSAVGIALLLPAVQAARAAARKAASSNNARQQVIALHLHADTWNGKLPRGTYPNPALLPERRLSWMSRILPYLEEDAVYNAIDFNKSWDDPSNRQAASSKVDVFLNPAVPEQEVNGYGATHYVGMAGLGENAATLPAGDPKAGVFGYDRAYSIDQIRDGTSNTIALVEVWQKLGPWAAGGPGTVRGFTQKPYLNGPDGFGGLHRAGANVAFMDGSVRFMRDDVDQNVLEAMATASGGEKVGF